MKRITANLITILIAAAVLLSGTLFSSYVLPAATEDEDGILHSCTVEINKPQEIIQEPTDPIKPADFFPATFARYAERIEDTLPSEAVLAQQKTFLTYLRDYLDILYNLKIDSLIMEKYTRVWQLKADYYSRYGGIMFSVDLVFTDARGVQWRITAMGAPTELLYVSCLKEDSVVHAPVNPVRDFREERLVPIEKVPGVVKDYNKINNALLRFRGRFFNLSPTNPYFDYAHSIGELLLTDPQQPIVWSVESQNETDYLLTCVSTDTYTPICFVLVDVQTETNAKTDILARIYMEEYGASVLTKPNYSGTDALK